MRRLKKILAWVAIVGGGLVLAACVFLLAQDQPRPTGEEGEDAEDLASEMESAIDLVGWARTGAVRWTFAGRNQHLWDRRRGLVRVRWDDVEVLLHEGGSAGRAYRNGREITGAEGLALRQRGNAAWVNDSFWLNPVAKIHDSGTTRSLVHNDQLLVEYESGGLTPGDAYLWHVSPDGEPYAWQLWVSVLPIGGVEVSWDRWITLDTGARISTRHVGPFGLAVELTDVEGAATLADLIGDEDPFEPILD
ncbi:MAG: hypothetical protein H6719_08120 [Sandaracinaceae bacterium]|nr:hypothetical protein [Sandaracinaceae bacterium]